MPGWFGNALAKLRTYILVEDNPGSAVADINEQNQCLQRIKYPDDVREMTAAQKSILPAGMPSVVITPALELQFQLTHLNDLLDYDAVTKLSAAELQARKEALQTIVATTDRRFYQSILSSLILANGLLTAFSMLDITANPHRYTADFTWEILQSGLKMMLLPLSAIVSLELSAKVADTFDVQPATQKLIKNAVLFSHALAGLKFGVYDGFSAATAWSMLSKIGQRMCLGGLIEAGIQPYIRKRFFVQKHELAKMAVENVNEIEKLYHPGKKSY